MKRLGAFLLMIFSLAGAAWQSYDLISQYLKYETVSRIEMQRAKAIFPPSVLVCNENMVQKRARNLTIGQIFRAAFHESDITKIKTRKYPNDWEEFHTRERSLINESFSFTKVIKKWEACYHIRMRRKQRISSHQIFSGDWVPRIFAVAFSERFVNISSYFYYHFLPKSNNYYGAIFTSTDMETRFPTGGRVGIAYSYSHLASISMSFPYDTDCWNYSKMIPGIESAGHCYESCLEKEFAVRGRKTPMFKTYFEDSPDLNRYRDKEDTTLRWSEETNGKCLNKCQHRECIRHDYSPRFLAQYAVDEVQFDVYAPIEPSIVSVSSPKIAQIDVITQMLSCISFWFAFSPMAMFGIDMYSHACWCGAKKRAKG